MTVLDCTGYLLQRVIILFAELLVDASVVERATPAVILEPVRAVLDEAILVWEGR